mmetsp:Transcript_10335/g.26277  ORF Transcript_10335/g.26277 Transcript_10335/m.26277 type:complete len:140 (-) Transcript_10335:67-486(-)
MSCLFNIFDLNQEGALLFQEVVMMVRLTMRGLRSMCSAPKIPDHVPAAVAREVFNSAGKRTDERVTPSEWYGWWSSDAVCRQLLNMFVWSASDQRGLQIRDLTTSTYHMAPPPSEGGPRPTRPASRPPSRGSRSGAVAA